MIFPVAVRQRWLFDEGEGEPRSGSHQLLVSPGGTALLWASVCSRYQ